MQDLYDETDAAPWSETKSSSDTKAGSGETALLSIGFFGDKKPKVGDTCTIKVEALHDGEAEVSYQKSGEPEGDEPEAGEAEPEPSNPLME